MMMLWRRWKRAAGIDFQHGKIVSDAFAEQLRGEGAPVLQRDGDRIGVIDHVLVRSDDAAWVDDGAGTY
jgi:nicotinamide riboside kinase